MPEQIPMTAEEIERLHAEWERLKGEGRRRAREELVKARSYGDFRENAEFHEAKRAQAVLEGRIKELEGVLGRAQAIQPGDTSQVAVGATVLASDLETLSEIRFSVCAPGSPEGAGVTITPDSPIGRALISKREGDEAEVETPSGKRRYKILSVTYAGSAESPSGSPESTLVPEGE